MMRRLGKRFLSVVLAIWMFLTMTVDGHAKAVLAIRDKPLYATAASVSSVSEGDGPTTDKAQESTYGALDSLKDVQGTTNEEAWIVEIDDWGNAFVNAGSSALDNQLTDRFGELCELTGAKIYNSGSKLLIKSQELTQSVRNIQKNIDGLAAKVGTPGSKGAKARLDKALANQAQKSSAAAAAATKGNLYRIGGKVLSGVSIGFSAYSIYKDVNSLGDLKHEHVSLRAVESGLYVANIGLSVASIGVAVATIAGVTVGAPVTIALGVAGLIVGTCSAFFGSDGFANLMNNTDNEFLRSFDNMVSSLLQFVKTAFGVGCYKPNIYIYGADGKLVRVVFEEPGLVVTSDPYYDPETGWKVIAETDGMLRDGNGSDYGYLFYESVTEKQLFDTENGFYIDAAERENKFKEILAAYGFNEAETDDFVEFWNEKLEEGTDYIMYPQYTENVDNAMPVHITPTPDSISRIWFVFEEYRQQNYEEAEILSFDRDGYYVVEWGGMIF